MVSLSCHSVRSTLQALQPSQGCAPVGLAAEHLAPWVERCGICLALGTPCMPALNTAAVQVCCCAQKQARTPSQCLSSCGYWVLASLISLCCWAAHDLQATRVGRPPSALAAARPLRPLQRQHPHQPVRQPRRQRPLQCRPSCRPPVWLPCTEARLRRSEIAAAGTFKLAHQDCQERWERCY